MAWIGSGLLNDDNDDFTSTAPAVKADPAQGKRKARAMAAGKADKATKKAKALDGSAVVARVAVEERQLWQLGSTGNVRVDVTKFRSRKYVDVRKWYKKKGTGEMCRTQKGIMLAPDQWDKLKLLFPTLKAAFAAARDSS
ncbi:uncharacterized protein AMSG_07412 [Thecamonas trahens ATCC 50062]|uniref:Transcriptional coactivator p15 (PC4) C-terminal domain-containing protein n=1 Tax=Thecamonas trahens ATCC 50062 TaxID=461836 RepID=A0A0L0DGR3_THETB|nr:hypothetical protein AMSG_07412 [Thecamonas trahens ATCC 50062]KNC51517.1 hypothetical protein AMSG_07412 [Thecamonas trahens ATCC 50062]|eukprot:XP_013755920.1 hypothetical protein AMSG_07412 [Thecamonas trahens ATCC 50062]